jgi:hypothetical protein
VIPGLTLTHPPFSGNYPTACISKVLFMDRAGAGVARKLLHIFSLNNYGSCHHQEDSDATDQFGLRA